ncbi:hypothetical protein CCAX7_13870 [Capsulimonas corticalis]|uniref:Uncharacterized protein n=2 Tax=Capsulimonas corticalis TaxID=2219043 RepID=A0A402D6S7_9BACT|nr:hypothetical protein CCAX7_13870 [Capsulimonas corticalis]
MDTRGEQTLNLMPLKSVFMPVSTLVRRITVAVVIIAVFLIAISAYYQWRRRLPPSLSSAEYQSMVSAFYGGVVAMNVGDDEHAAASLLAATRIAPGEPAAWGNLGLFQLRKGSFGPARAALDKAHILAPDNSQIEDLLGLLAKQQGQTNESVADFRQAVKLDPTNVQARYELILALQQLGADDGGEAQQQLRQISLALPKNLFAALQMAALDAKAGDLPQVKTLIRQVATQSSGWPSDSKQQLASVQQTLAGGDSRAVVTQVTFLSNLLQTTPQYQADRDFVVGDQTVIGTPLENFLVLPRPSAAPAPSDMELTYAAEPLAPASGGGEWSMARTFWFSAQTPATLLASAAQVRIIDASGGANTFSFPGKGASPTPDEVLSVDWNNDFNTDIVLAGAGGLRFYQQGAEGKFIDAGARTKLPISILNGSYAGVWAADIDSDGDLDLILGGTSGPPIVLRNNGDGTFTPIQPLHGPTAGVRAFVMADFDDDGDPDAALIDGAGKLWLFENRRNGLFASWPVPAVLQNAIALSIADIDHSGVLNLVVLSGDGVLQCLTRRENDWAMREIGRWPSKFTTGGSAISQASLTWADLDNNGALDLIGSAQSTTVVWMNDGGGKLQPLPITLNSKVVSVDIADKTGGPDLIGVSPSGQPVRWGSHGVKKYAWQQVRLRSALAGDQRNNSFGIGGTVELRAGLLYEKQLVMQPVTQFGLGIYAKADYIHILWPNGSPQGEFALKPDQIAEAPERLKGSCPWLFADGGHGMTFVTDLIWRSPLGLRINAQNTAGVAMTRDRVKIAGDQLTPKDGFYDLAITAELWETHFFDYMRLMTVDHPLGTEVFIDERFAIPPPPLAIHVVTPPIPVLHATDDLGQDVTNTVAVRDGRYLDTFGRGGYQGVTRDHYVELDLGAAPASPGRQWLVAQGWIHPTDSSINLALSQGRHAPPTSLSLEAPDGHGGWGAVRKNLGFPEGKKKTILLDLTGVFRPGAPRRVRLRTNLEIYWDFLGTAVDTPSPRMRIQNIASDKADLHYRGYSVMHQANASSPELPDYDNLMGKRQNWIDLIGFYTRYGDVRPLLAQVDDRYVIMNAGDEMRLRFPAVPAPPSGWKRDYVLEADGWVKDGDLNTAFSKTVLPLPSHANPDYSRPPGRLEDDPVYKAHQEDWRSYQTRYVTPRMWRNTAP